MKDRFIPILGAIFIILIDCLQPSAQHAVLRYQDLGSSGELSHRQTLCLFEDSRGFIWIGTVGGLDRWDGRRIRSFTYAPFDTLGLPATRILSMADDENNNLWLGTQGKGLIKYDLVNERFLHVYDPQKHPELFVVKGIKNDPSGFLLLGTTRGLYSYHPANDRYELYSVRDPAAHVQGHDSLDIDAIAFDTLGVVWVASGTRLYYVDKADKVLKAQPYDSPLHGHIHWGTRMCTDAQGMIWMLQGKTELVRFDPYSKKIDFVWPRKFEREISSQALGGIGVTEEGKVLFGRGEGLMQYDPSIGEVTYIMNEPKDINDILVDDSGNIMVATYIRGIRILDQKSTQIQLFTREYLGYNEIAKTHITDILRDDQLYWIGTGRAGLLKLDPETDHKVFYHQGIDPENLASNNIQRIHRDRHNNIWIMAGSVLHLYNRQENTFKRFSFGHSQRFMEDREGNFWIAGTDHLLQFNPVTFDSAKYPLNPPLGSFWGNAFVRDSSGYFWLGGSNSEGLIRIDPRNGRWRRYQFDAKNPASLPSNLILTHNTILYDSRNRLWVGTSAGLSRIITHPDSDSISCINYFTDDGLIGNYIVGLTEDIEGNIWIGTNNGISVIKKNGAIENFTVKDGLSQDCFPLTSDLEGNIYTGSEDFVKIPSTILRENEKIPSIFLTDVKLFGESIFPGEKSPIKKAIMFAEQIDLKHRENFIRFEFASLNYNHPEKNQYRYILKGIDQDTVEALGKNYAEYTNLKPGNYIFWVTGSNNSNIRNKEGTQLLIRIHPPPWASWWAYSAYGLIAIGLLLSWRYYDLRRLHLKHRAEQLSELDRLKTRFFANISHEFRTPLTLILGPIKKLYDGSYKGNPRSVYAMIMRNGQQLLNLITQLLDFSKMEAGAVSLQASEEDLVGFLKKIFANFESNAQFRQITYIFQSDTSELLVFFDRNHMEKIVTNLLSNAFKYTPEGEKIYLKLNKSVTDQEVDRGNGIVEIQVEDTGAGIAADKLPYIFDRFYQVHHASTHTQVGAGIGLALVKELVELHHGSISVTSTLGQGSTFSVHFPLGKTHLKGEEMAVKSQYIPVDHFERYTPLEVVHTDIRQEIDTRKDISLLLIIDDNSDMRNYLKEILADDHQLVEAENGKKGLKIAIERIPDLVISDIMMPEMDGQELCEKLKKDERTCHIPVVLLTARAGECAKLEGLEYGADDYITKPFSPLELKVRIKNLIDQRKTLRERFRRDITLQPEELAITSADERFLQKTMELMAKYSIDSGFSAEMFARELGMSRSQLHRKLKALTDQSATEFIRSHRLIRARQMIDKQFGNLAEIAYEVGFNDPSYFAKCFKKQFGLLPIEYANKMRGEEV